MRREFPAKVKVAAFERADKHCEKCTAPLFPGKFTYDHINPDYLGGEPTLENCQVICSACDKDKTRGDQKKIGKTRRIRKRNAGVKRPRTITRWRRFNGEQVIASRER